MSLCIFMNSGSIKIHYFVHFWLFPHVKSNCLSLIKAAVVGKLLFLDDDSLLEKMPLVRADEKDDAGPLPVKVHIDATTL